MRHSRAAVGPTVSLWPIYRLQTPAMSRLCPGLCGSGFSSFQLIMTLTSCSGGVLLSCSFSPSLRCRDMDPIDLTPIDTSRNRSNLVGILLVWSNDTQP